MLQPEVVLRGTADKSVCVIPQVVTTAYDRLALIITRLDSDETIDPVGNYRVMLEASSG